MIESVSIRNFKNIRSQDISLERLTVFVGANGSGKSSVLEAIRNVVLASGRTPDIVFSRERHFDWQYTRSGSGNLSITCATPFGEFGISAKPPKTYPPEADDLEKGRWTSVFTPDFPSFHNAVRNSIPLDFLRLNSALLSKPSYVDEVPPRLKANGAGLASVLAYMALNDPDSFTRLVDNARELIPRLRRIRFRKAPVQRSEIELVRFGKDTVQRRQTRSYQGEMILFDFDNAENVAAQTVSEGTLIYLGLLAVLHGSSPPQILLMDDIEQGLHPLAQKLLVHTLRRIMAIRPGLQVLATAHSPLLLDYLDAKEVRLMTIGADGHAVCGRLTDHPEFERWKEEMAPGEMWSVFGDRWPAETGAGK